MNEPGFFIRNVASGEEVRSQAPRWTLTSCYIEFTDNRRGVDKPCIEAHQIDVQRQVMRCASVSSTSSSSGSDTDEANARPESPTWPALKFEPIDPNCQNCGSTILPSPLSLGSFSLSLMASTPSGPKPTLTQRCADLQAEVNRLRGTSTSFLLGSRSPIDNCQIDAAKETDRVKRKLKKYRHELAKKTAATVPSILPPRGERSKPGGWTLVTAMGLGDQKKVYNRVMVRSLSPFPQ